jgi:hypothetical protein
MVNPFTDSMATEAKLIQTETLRLKILSSLFYLFLINRAVFGWLIQFRFGAIQLRVRASSLSVLAT